MSIRQSNRTVEAIKDGGFEDIQFSYGIRAKDPLGVERHVNLQEQRLTKHKWLGRLLMASSGVNFAQQEQRMRDDIVAAMRAAEPLPVYHHDFETGELHRIAEQPQGSAHQRPEQQPIPEAPVEVAGHYVGRHRAEG